MYWCCLCGTGRSRNRCRNRKLEIEGIVASAPREMVIAATAIKPVAAIICGYAIEGVVGGRADRVDELTRQETLLLSPRKCRLWMP